MEYGNLIHALMERWWPFSGDDTKYGQAKAIAYDKYRPSEDRDIRVFAAEHFSFRFLYDRGGQQELIWWPGAPSQYESADLWVASQYHKVCTSWVPDSIRETLDVKTILHGHKWSLNTFYSSMDYLLGWERLDNTLKFAFFLPRKLFLMRGQTAEVEREKLPFSLVSPELFFELFRRDMASDFVETLTNIKPPPPLDISVLNLPYHHIKPPDKGNGNNHHSEINW